MKWVRLLVTSEVLTIGAKIRVTLRVENFLWCVQFTATYVRLNVCQLGITQRKINDRKINERKINYLEENQ